MVKFKKGDKVEVLDDAVEDLTEHLGEKGVIDSLANGTYCDCMVKLPNGDVHEANFDELKLISSNYKPKAPTHLVVWEEDVDPCKFFTSEKEAKDFIKELSEKSEVKKDSIVLVEIKSVTKIGIRKSTTLIPKGFKI